MHPTIYVKICVYLVSRCVLDYLLLGYSFHLSFSLVCSEKRWTLYIPAAEWVQFFAWDFSVCVERMLKSSFDNYLG